MGFIDVEIRNNEFQYNFKIKSKFSLLTGKSSIGKTTLCKLISMLNDGNHPIYSDKHYMPGLHCNLYRTVYNLSDYVDYLDILDKTSNNIYFIDETSKIFKQKNVFELLLKSSNYFVLITRADIPANVPIGITDIYTLDCVKTESKRYYNVFKELFEVDLVDKFFNCDLVLSEDTGSGLDMCNRVFIEDLTILSSSGNSNVPKILSNYSHKRVLLFIDFSAFGPYFKEVRDVAIRNKLILRYFYSECFEHILLRSLVYTKKFVDDNEYHFDFLKLSHDSSFEQYFYRILVGITSNLDYCETYTKKFLTSFLLKDSSLQKVIEDLINHGVSHSLLRTDLKSKDINPIDKLRGML